ncbi:MAG: phosphate ABC transporter substrate-binding protein [Anaerolineae bacterium]|nr:phosphate ABC transporter substrate-binding protein [Anaerolineae bacterium]
MGKSRMAIFYLLSTLLFLLPACLATPTPPPPPLVLKAAGSTSAGPLLAALASAYSAQHPHVTFDIQAGGSQLGQSLVETGRIDLGLVSWPPQNLSANLRSIPIARDAVAVIVHPTNNIEGLSLAELQDIFGGRLLDWQEVGGPARPIQVISREDGSGTRAIFEAAVMEQMPVTPAAIVLPSSQAVIDFVAQNPAAIAYVSFAFVDKNVYPVPLEGVAPSPESLADRSYPLSRDLVMIVLKRSQPELSQFIDFVLSPAGQAIVATKWAPVK